MFYSKTSNGFYDPTINTVIPSDAVEITNEQYQALLQAQQNGQVIQADADGNPIAVTPVLSDQNKKNICKSQAKQLLAASDWSVLPDVQITNKAAFDNYRAILRGYVISPVTDPTWPVEPQPIWG